ncbi:hypothetical protein FMUBM48_15460 [Nocardia cyriacigeorgica]|nr:hypothetical protein FMUBM48_15460 [Nocardia cyriacigeorgica]
MAAASVSELSSEPQADSAKAAAARVAIPMVLAEVGMPRTLIDAAGPARSQPAAPDESWAYPGSGR